MHGDATQVARVWPADSIRLDAYDADAGAGTFYAACGFEHRGSVDYKSTPLRYYELLEADSLRGPNVQSPSPMSHMRLIAITASLALTLGTANAQSAPSVDIRSFSWIEGTWQNTRSGDFERWQFNSAKSQWDGLSYRVKGTDTLVTERLSIVCEASSCDYVAEVHSNPAPVRFRIAEATDKSFKSSNPQHDFPQFINYEVISPTGIRATIGAGTRTMAFEFRKVEAR